MSKIPKVKKNQIILVVIGAVLVIAGIWFSLIQAQKVTLIGARKRVTEVRDKVSKAESILKRADQIQADLQARQADLEKIESSMAAGDLYLWMINTMNNFNASRKVTVADFARESVGEVGLLPKFPYKAATFPITGSGYFHDIGRFLADFENAFPYARVQNLELTPGRAGTSADPEKLSFRFEVVALVKPSNKNSTTQR